MGKKQNYTSKPVNDIPLKEGEIERSKSYKRVINHGKYEGIYLSKSQLRQICDYLESTNQIEGIWFVIGSNKKEINLNHDDEKNDRKTIELLPYKLDSESKLPQIINNGFLKTDSAVVNHIINNDSDAKFLDDNIAKRRLDNPTGTETIPPIVIVTPGGGTSQRTPPPPAE